MRGEQRVERARLRAGRVVAGAEDGAVRGGGLREARGITGQHARARRRDVRARALLEERVGLREEALGDACADRGRFEREQHADRVGRGRGGAQEGSVDRGQPVPRSGGFVQREQPLRRRAVAGRRRQHAIEELGLARRVAGRGRSGGRAPERARGGGPVAEPIVEELAEPREPRRLVLWIGGREDAPLEDPAQEREVALRARDLLRRGQHVIGESPAAGDDLGVAPGCFVEPAMRRRDLGEPQQQRRALLAGRAIEGALELAAEIVPRAPSLVDLEQRREGAPVVRLLVERAPVGEEGGGCIADVAPLDRADGVEELASPRRIGGLLQRRAVEREALLGAALLAQQRVDVREEVGRRGGEREGSPEDRERPRHVAALHERLARVACEESERRVVDGAVAERVAQGRGAGARVASCGAADRCAAPTRAPRRSPRRAPRPGRAPPARPRVARRPETPSAVRRAG